MRDSQFDAPAGFVASDRTGPFVDLIGPLHTLTDQRGMVLGLRADHQHTNARGFVHGAVVVTSSSDATRRREPIPRPHS